MRIKDVFSGIKGSSVLQVDYRIWLQQEFMVICEAFTPQLRLEENRFKGCSHGTLHLMQKATDLWSYTFHFS